LRERKLIKYVLDTDICIFWLRGDKKIEQKILDVGMERISLTVITQCELYYGVFKSDRVEDNLKVINDLCSKIEIINFSKKTPLLYGKIKAELENRGIGLDDADILIGCLTLENEATLVTNNVEHFKRIKGLNIENWRAK